MKPLAGITVLDISRLLPGGFASLLLAEQGARVIKIEEPGVGDYYRALYSGGDLRSSPEPPGHGIGRAKPDPIPRIGGRQVEVLNQGKESLGLNLKTEEGRNVFKKLVRRADVVIENFRPGTLARLKLGYSTLRRVNPALILCSITGFGQKGSHLAGHDLNYLGLSGLLSRIRDENGQIALPDFQIVDLATAQEAVFRIVAALLSLRKKKKGCWIDCSMLEAGISWARLYSGENPEKSFTGLMRYGVYKTQDDRWMSLAALEPKFWKRFCEKIGHKEWAEEEGMIEFENLERKKILKELFQEKPLQEWEEMGQKGDMCLFPVYDREEIFFPKEKKTPKLGENTNRILKEIGFKKGDIRLLIKKGVVA